MEIYEGKSNQAIIKYEINTYIEDSYPLKKMGYLIKYILLVYIQID